MKKTTVFIASIIVLAVLCTTFLVTTFTYKHKVDTLETKIHKQEKKIKDQKEEIDVYEKFVKESATNTLDQYNEIFSGDSDTEE